MPGTWQPVAGLQGQGLLAGHVLPYWRAVAEGGVEAPIERSRFKLNLRYWTLPEIEEAIVRLAFQQLAFGMVRVSNELRKRRHCTDRRAFRGIWLHDLIQAVKHGCSV